MPHAADTAPSPSSRARGASRLLAALALVAVAAGCSVLPEPPARADVYDFGMAPAAQGGAVQSLPPLALAEVEAVGLPEASSALLYRLAYANGQQLRPYRQARWSQPPAVLLQQALRASLGSQRAVLSGDDGLALLTGPGQMPTVLRAQLEEFSHVFHSPQQSSGVLQLRVLVADASAAGETLVAQRLFMVEQPAATPDAAGGAQALAEAARQVATQVAHWLEQLGR